MPLGFVLAAAVMSLPEMKAGGVKVLVPGTLLVGLVIFDTTLVVVSRRRRGTQIWSGARAHTTHRLLPVVRSPRAVVIVLAFAQTVLCGLAIVATELGSTASAILAALLLAAGLLALIAFEAGWSPARSLWPGPRRATGQAGWPFHLRAGDRGWEEGARTEPQSHASGLFFLASRLWITV
jgi:hypothetical protein